MFFCGPQTKLGAVFPLIFFFSCISKFWRHSIKNLAKSVEFTTQKISTNKLGIFWQFSEIFTKLKKKKKKERTVNKFIAAS